MDETGFRIDVGRQYKVITRTGNSCRYLMNSDNRDYVTFIESISVTDESHASIIVLKAFSLLKKWVVNELVIDTILTYNETGYLNDEINL